MTAGLRRKLTTILAADAEGYSRAMGRNEAQAVADLRAARAVFARFIERHQGRIANTAGDSLIAEFPSVVEAVQCAIEVQNELTSTRRDRAEPLRFRIGIHLGDVIVDGEDLLGDGVNVAARLEGLAEPGGILISRQVYEQVHAKLTVGFQYLGEKRPKNLAEDVEIYRVAIGKTVAPPVDPQPARRDRPTDVAPARPRTGRPSSLAQLALSFAGVGGALFLVDLLTGDQVWAHWPLLGLLVLFGWRAAPFFEGPRLNKRTIRGAIIIAGLFAINLFSWSGVLWALWPAGAIVLLELLRRLRSNLGT